MSLTEKEARKFYCPTKQGTKADTWLCIGAACMAWRWHKKHEARFGHPQPCAELPRDEWTGYCGLGGKP